MWGECVWGGGRQQEGIRESAHEVTSQAVISDQPDCD